MTAINNIPVNSIGGRYEIKLTRQVSTEQLCNHNELINADFRQGRLVNQRNITDKTGNGYTVDMWYISTGNPNQCGIRVEDDGIVLYKHQDNVFFDFATLIEDGGKFSDQTCTISVLAKCSTLGVLISTVHQGAETAILNKDITGDSTKFEIYAYTFQVPALAFGDYLKIAFRHRQFISKSEQPKIQKAMLECGDIGTLENWHGDYATELLKCQRYLEHFDEIRFSGMLFNAGNITTNSVTFTNKRIVPTISYKDLAGNAGKCSVALSNNNILHNITLPDIQLRKNSISLGHGSIGMEIPSSAIIVIADVWISAEL